MGTRHAGQHLGSRNIATFLEERIAQAKADGLADPVAVAVSGGCERESRKGGAWEVVGVEVAEKIRSHLRAQFIDVRLCAHDIKRQRVDQFKWPSSHAYDHIATSQFVSPPNCRAKANVGERAPNIRVHLDHDHY